MSRSRKKFSHSYNCCVNHGAESKHFTMKRRQYRRRVKQVLKKNWHDENMVLPSSVPYYSNWDAPSDGGGCMFDPPTPTNPFELRYSYRHIKRITHPTIQEQVENMVEAIGNDIWYMYWYEKNFRK